MAIFGKKASKKNVSMTEAPEEPETKAELKHIEEASKHEDVIRSDNNVRAVEVPVFLSQAQVNNMIIENNMMLKELMAMANEED